MNRYVIGLAPALLVAIGLHVGHSVKLTFMLFYSWLCVVPCLDYLLLQKQKLSSTIEDLGMTVNVRQAMAGISLGLSFLMTLLVGTFLFARHVVRYRTTEGIVGKMEFCR